MSHGSAMRSPLDTPRCPPSRKRRTAPTVHRPTYSFAPFGALAAIAGAMSRRVEEEQRLYEITVPGLAIDSEFTDVRRSLLAAFPRVLEVLPTGTSETLRITYAGEDEIDAWCETLSRAVARRRRARLPASQPSAPR